jgi:hypothetical protein
LCGSSGFFGRLSGIGTGGCLPDVEADERPGAKPVTFVSVDSTI